MPSILRTPGWKIPDSFATPESVALDRRRFLKDLGILGLGAMGVAVGCGRASGTGGGQNVEAEPELIANYSRRAAGLFPASRNPKYVLDRELTDEKVAASHNNFYEFTTDKSRVWRRVGKFQPDPWTVEFAGLCERPGTMDVYDLMKKLPLEERLYRHRCVEAWAMAVPWTGFPLASLLDFVGVKNDARYVRFVSFNQPDQAPGIREQPWYPWPYFEALRMDEARNELAFVAVGIYGHPLPKQHGAPLRLVTPWKYGFKSAKSIVRIELVKDQPKTFWNVVAPSEYDFLANVNPAVPHPRWSQATETLIGTGNKVKTLPMNGYGEYVARLYG